MYVDDRTARPIRGDADHGVVVAATEHMARIVRVGLFEQDANGATNERFVIPNCESVDRIRFQFDEPIDTVFLVLIVDEFACPTGGGGAGN